MVMMVMVMVKVSVVAIRLVIKFNVSSNVWLIFYFLAVC